MRSACVVTMVVASAGDHRADAGVGEQLEQHDVGHAAVEDVGRADAAVDGVQAGVDLGDHAAAEGAVVDEPLQGRPADATDEAAGVGDVGQQALDVGEVDELLGAERLGDRAGHRVGVDVVGLPGGVGADGGHHRDEVLGQEPLEDGRVDRVDVADEAEVGVASLGHDQPGVLARQAHGQRARAR